MNQDKRKNPPPTFPQRGKKYTALFDLQDFLEKEIQEASPGAFYRSFTPITDGLGLESPKAAPPITEKTPAAEPPRKTSAPSNKWKSDINWLFDEPIFMAGEDKASKVSEILPKPTSGIPVSAILESMVPKTLGNETSLRTVMEPVKETTPEVTQEEKSVRLPPKLPTVSFMRRLLSVLVDQLFVLTLWGIALVITSNALHGFQAGFSFDILNDFSNPLFQRFAILEFSTLWIAYFAVSLGIMDLTFGMWVWGLRVSYGRPEDSQYWMRRMMRVIWSFLFFAPFFPALLLAFRRRGRNVLDVLSGTNLYVAA